MSFTIYCHTHTSGKRYIGLTAGTMAHRWGQHVANAKKGKTNCPALYAALRKYGPAAFSHEVLEVVPTLELAKDAEARWIEHFHSRAPDGYNIEPGGRVRVVSDASRLRMKEAALRREASLTTEQRHERALRAAATVTPEQRAEGTRKRLAQLTPEKRADMGRKISAAMSPERRAVLGALSKTPEERARRSERMKQQQAARTQDSRREAASRAARAAHNNLTPAERSEKQRKVTTAVMALLTPEERSARVRKAWATRKAKPTQVE
jgi:group I intron endonuclease